MKNSSLQSNLACRQPRLVGCPLWPVVLQRGREDLDTGSPVGPMAVTGPKNGHAIISLRLHEFPRLSCDLLQRRILRISSSLDTRYPYVWPFKMGHNQAQEGRAGRKARQDIHPAD